MASRSPPRPATRPSLIIVIVICIIISIIVLIIVPIKYCTCYYYFCYYLPKRLRIPLSGQHHLGMDDVSNLAKIMTKLIGGGLVCVQSISLCFCLSAGAWVKASGEVHAFAESTLVADGDAIGVTAPASNLGGPLESFFLSAVFGTNSCSN